MAHGSHFPPSHAFSRGRVMPFLDSLGLVDQHIYMLIDAPKHDVLIVARPSGCLQIEASLAVGGALRPPNRLNSNVMLIDQMGVIENQKPYGIPLSHPNTNISPS
ncbi:hypothetical protein JHK86_052275 [Glycine max]|nr:hypothetical protein JHK86_052275 [Glycine max]